MDSLTGCHKKKYPSVRTHTYGLAALISIHCRLRDYTTFVRAYAHTGVAVAPENKTFDACGNAQTRPDVKRKFETKP